MPHMKRVLVLGHLDRQSTRSIVQGITKYANLYGPWVFYHRIPFYKTPDACGERFISQEAYESELRGLLENGHIDGIVAEMASGSAAERILPRGFPAVLIPVQEPVGGYINLVSSGDETGQMAADYLRNLGFRHIAFFGLPHVYWSQRREQSFCRGLKAHGVTPFVFQQQCSAGPFCWTEELEEITGALRTLPRPLAVWAWNDDLAARVIEACRTLNDAVPDEVCILGTDNDELFCSLCDPPLSSIALNFERAGYEMAEALEALMAGQAPSAGEIELTPLHVVERQSTEIQAVDDPEVARAVRFIRRNAQQPLQVADVVNHLAISRSLLYKRFQAVIGRSIHDEIKRVRVEAIAKVLVSTNTPVKEIAYRLGFPGENHLSRYFKGIKGCSPQSYRQRFGRQ